MAKKRQDTSSVKEARKSDSIDRFNHREREPFWQKKWEKDRVYSPDLLQAKKPFYNLMMFPYPSAEGLHVGNMYAFTGVDVYGRFKRMNGCDVFEPIGLDGFGIHSENYALKVNRNPKEQAKISQKNFYRQLRATGNGYDWGRTVETYDPGYYKWTQWIFTQMFKAGLAYKAEAAVNWCPSCKTVLADEQVVDEVCERCKTPVTQKNLNQWFFRIATGQRFGKGMSGTYADSLLNNLTKIDWADKIKIGQKNWIGRKEGINIKYQIAGSIMGSDLQITGSGLKGAKGLTPTHHIECFTTRPDTNFGATFIVVGPEHPFVASLLSLQLKVPSSKLDEIKKYVDETREKTQDERIAQGAKKTGVFTGLYAINHLNGARLPIWISDFVLGDVGTGAVVGVPGHDLRDFQFAQTFGLLVIRVVVGKDGDASPITREEQVQEESGTMINSEFLNGLDIHSATKRIMDYLEVKGWGKRVVHYHLRDWLISRQRYWGAPIPMIFCKHCAEKKIGYKSVGVDLRVDPSSQEPKGEHTGSPLQNDMIGWFPVPDEYLPVLLPDVKNWKPTGTGKAPLASISEFVHTKCPHCGGDADRETDVCDTFLDSSWYFLRYPSVGMKAVKTPRGWQAGALAEAMTPPMVEELTRPWDPEITKKWLPVNMYIGGAEHTVLHLLYARFVTMALYDMGYLDFEEPFTRFYAHGLIIKDGAKMSKSRGNVVIPDEYIAAYGADALRTYLMFLGPFDQGGDFRDTGIAGMHRFAGRVWRLLNDWIQSVGVDLRVDPSLVNDWIQSVGVDLRVDQSSQGVDLRVDQSSQGVDLRVDPSSQEPKGEHTGSPLPQNDLNRFMHKTIKKVTEDLEKLHYNTAISAIMEYVNALSNFKGQIPNAQKTQLFDTLLLLLAPFMPHMTEELWSQINADQQSIHLHPWPVFDPRLIIDDEVTIVVQINGKMRESIKMENGKWKMENEVEQEARNSEKVKKYLEGKTIKKTIFVPGKLINFVV